MPEIPVRSLQGCMPEGILNYRHGYTLLGKLPGTRMSQAMEVNPLVYFSTFLEPLHQRSYIRINHGLTIQGAEERNPIAELQLLSLVEPPIQGNTGIHGKTHGTGLVSLAVQNPDNALICLHILGVQSQGFRESEPSPVA